MVKKLFICIKNKRDSQIHIEIRNELLQVCHSFVIYDNLHFVGLGLMKENATFEKGSLDITKPMMLFGLRFSRVKHNG